MQPKPHLNQHFCPGSQDSAKPRGKKPNNTLINWKARRERLSDLNYSFLHTVQQFSSAWSVFLRWKKNCFIRGFLLLFWGVVGSDQPEITLLAPQWDSQVSNTQTFSPCSIPISLSLLLRCCRKKEHLAQMLTKESFPWGASNWEKSTELVIPNLQQQTSRISTSGSRRSWGCCSPLQQLWGFYLLLFC